MNKRVFVAALIAALVTRSVFSPVIGNGFVTWEDALTITGNPYIAAITPRFFHWAFFQQHGLFWMPLTWLSLAFDYHFWELDPFGFHLTNLIIHIVNTFMAALLTVRLLQATDRYKMGKENKPLLCDDGTRLALAALTAGLLFGLHPLKVEAVAWASERKGLLNAMFVLPAFMSYLCYIQQPESTSSSFKSWFFQRHYLAALILFVFSLLCKPMTVTVPVILLILDWYLGRLIRPRTRRTALLEKLPFFACSGAASVITLMLKPPGTITLSEITLSSRLFVACRAVFEYLRLMIWPSDLMALYDHPANSVLPDSARFWWPVVLVVAISLACITTARRQKGWLTIWMVYLVVLLPVLGFTQNGGQSMADRFMYLPSIGLGLIPAMVCYAYGRTKAGISCLLVITIAASFALGRVSRTLIPTWHDTESLWTRAIVARPTEAGRARYQRGMEYLERGDYLKALEDANEALAILGKIGYTRIGKAYELRAMAYEGLGRQEEAAKDYYTLSRLPSAWSTPAH